MDPTDTIVRRRHQFAWVTIPAALAVVSGLAGRMLGVSSYSWGETADNLLSLFMSLCLASVFAYVGWALCRFKSTRFIFGCAIFFLLTTNVVYTLNSYPSMENLPIVGDNSPYRSFFVPALDFASVAFIVIGFLMTIRELAATLDVLGKREEENRVTHLALKESEERFRDLVEDASEIIYRLDLDGILRYVSPSGFKQTGYGPDDLLGHNCLEFVHEDYVALLRNETQRMLDELDDSPVRIEFQGVLHGGEVAWVGQTMRLVIDDGEPQYFHAVAEDITHRKASEAALRESQARVEQLLDQVPAMFWTTDADLNLISNLGSALDRIDIHEGDRVGDPVDEIVEELDTDAEFALEKHRRALAGETVQYKIRVKGRQLQAAVQPMRDESGTIVGVLGVALDVTESEAQEHALAQSEDRYRRMYESTPLMMFSADSDGNIINVNRYWLDRMGYAREDVLGKPLWDFLTEDTKADSLAAWTKLWDAGEVRDAPRTFVTSDGAHIDVMLSAIVVQGSGGKSDTTLAYAVDVTERKRVEKEKEQFEARLQHTQKLESLGVLAGGIAHDFNNILMGVLGNASLALIDLDEASPLRSPLQDIETAARRAAALCGQMLAYSGRGAFVTKPLQLNATIVEVRSLLTASLSKRINIVLDLDENLPFVDADETQLNQICMNLIINGAEAIGDDSGTVTIRTRTKQCSAKDFEGFFFADESAGEGEYIILTVEDDGCGMAEEVRHRIFEPFYTTKFTGRGLGMAVVVGIVRSHHGAIQLESAENEGATFTVALPVATIPAVEQKKILDPTDDAYWKYSGTALIVDDEPAVCAVAKRALERSGMHVLVAENGKTGLEAFIEHRDEIDLIVLDLTMPIMSGSEVYQAIRDGGSDVPVLLSSGYTSQDVVDLMGDHRGAVDFLQKPYGAIQLIDHVRAFLDKAASANN